MAEDTNYSASAGREEGAGRGNRQAGGREPGGFRIRLSDNEMRAARALQEAFGLRSTVAVLGFSLRTLAQQLEEGQLEELVALHRSQLASRGGGPGTGPRRGGERRRERTEGRWGATGRGQRIDPFARPSRPAVAPEAVTESEEQPPSPAPEAEAPVDTVAEPAAATEQQQEEAVEVPASVDDRA